MPKRPQLASTSRAESLLPHRAHSEHRADRGPPGKCALLGLSASVVEIDQLMARIVSGIWVETPYVPMVSGSGFPRFQNSNGPPYTS